MNENTETNTECAGDKGLIRRFIDGRRRIVCAVCEADLTDPKDLFGDWAGASVQRHYTSGKLL